MSTANNRIATDATLQDILAAIQAIAPGLVTTTQRGFLAPAPFIDGGMIKDASANNKGLMTVQHVNDLSEVRARPHNHSYDGRNLKTIFGNAAAFAAAFRNGDFSKIQDGDYWPLTLSGTIHDYAANTDKTLSSAVFNLEVCINPYWRYGDSGAITGNVPHLLLVSRDCLPWTLQFRSENTTWYDSTKDNPWLGSALYETLNNSTNGLLKLIQASELGPYLYTGPNGKGMRSLMETKGPSDSNTTGWGWKDRGVLFLPTEQEVWGQTVFADSQYHSKGSPLQWSIFAGSRRHISKGIGNGGSRCSWWCESSSSGDTAGICAVNNGGNPGSLGAAYTTFCAPVCFLLA